MQPAFLIDRARGCFGVVEVTLHHLRATDPNLTGLPDTRIPS